MFHIRKKLKKEYGKAQTEIITADIQRVLRKFSGKLKIKNARDRKVIRTREAVLESDEFKALWDRIKYKTTYRVEFDNSKLIDDCALAIDEACSHITTTRAQFRKADIAIGKDGVTADETCISGSTRIQQDYFDLPDIITDLQDKTQLTRKSIVQILIKSKVLENFKRNPQQFIDCCVEAINQTKRSALIDGIRYTQIGDEHYYAQELFAQEELKGYMENTLEVQKSVYTHVVYDSAGPEKTFAEDLEKNEKVKVYAKLPKWFKVPTPLGTYNPDWAVVVEDHGEVKLYFVVETKSSVKRSDLRYSEDAKMKCGKKHFQEVAEGQNAAQYINAIDVKGMMKYVE
jgi:type III restriction enzyme